MRHTPDGPIVQYVLDADVACYDCGLIFQPVRIELKETRKYLTGHSTLKIKEAN